MQTAMRLNKSTMEAASPAPTNGKFAINSKEFRLSIFIILATILAQTTGFDVEQSFLDRLADIDWEKWDSALIATAFAIIRYFFTQGKIIGLLPIGKKKKE